MMREKGLWLCLTGILSLSLASGNGASPSPEGEAKPSYPIVDTGVATFYSNDAVIPAPAEGAPFYGQDATYQGNEPSYTDNGDGTITDNVTGLMWQKDMGSKMSFDEAAAVAPSLRLGGYADWRIPSIKELYSLILFTGQSKGESAVKAFIDESYFIQPLGDTAQGERPIDAQTWSATKYVGTTMRGNETIFGVNFVDGRIKGYPKIGNRTGRSSANRMFFRMVRGNPAYGRNDFVDNNDGTISDRATGLMWQKADDGTARDWESSLAYAENLVLAGHSDWRLPDAKELQSIVDYTRAPDVTHSAAIHPLFQTTSIADPDGVAGQYPFFWTGTTHLDGPNPYASAVYIAFGKALGKMRGLLMDMHGAGAQRSDPKSGNRESYPQFFGPQGDLRSVYNYVRCVRNITKGGPVARIREGAPMRVVTLGTGTPQFNAARSGPSALIRQGDGNYLVDMGNGTQAGLSRLGLSPRQLSALIITHHHLDHNEEFIPLFIGICLAGGAAEIIGPPGTKALAAFILEFYAEDIRYRLRRQGGGASKIPSPPVREIKGGEAFVLGSIMVTTAKVNHALPTVAYRFDRDGRSIVVSGDLTYSESLVDLARAADVLVMDSGGSPVRAGAPGRGPIGNRPGAGAGGGDLRAHASLQEVGEMAQKAGVKKLVLTHIGPGTIDEAATQKALGRFYSGEVVVGHDGLEVTPSRVR